MQKLAEICIRRPVFAAMLILSLVVVGSAAYFNLGVDRLPEVDLPTVAIRTTLRGASPEEVETQVSEIIEEAVNTVEGIEELRSISGTGSSIVIAQFNLSRDVDVAAQDVRDRVAAVLNRLPDEVDPPVINKFNNEGESILTLALSGERQVRELTEIADKVVKKQIERSEGVGEVRIEGGRERSVNIWVDAQKLAAYQIPITAVRDAIARQNADVPGGQITGATREQTLRTMGRLQTPGAFNDLILATANGQPIRVKDIGKAEDGTKEQRSTSRLNGQPTVVLEIRRQSGANTVAVIEGVKAKLAEIQGQVPADVKLEVIRDQSRYIYNALHEINVHLVLGSILAALVVLAFMRSWRSTIIAGVAIPASVISTFGMMWALDFTLNSVTMLALVLMVGVVIDDAIVVLENIFRFVEEKKMNAFQAARAATAEIGLAVLATTLSLVVIFVPVSFMSSVSGRFLYQFGITAAVAVMVSLLVSFTLTPMMSARMLKTAHGTKKGPQPVVPVNGDGASDGNGEAGGNGAAYPAGAPRAELDSEDPGEREAAGGSHGHGHDARSRGGFYGYLDRSYAWMLAFSMRHRLAVSILALLVVASSYPLYKSVRQEYTPGNVDEGEFSVSVTGPQGISLPAMDRAMGAVEEEIRQTPGVRLVLASTGGSFLGSVNSGRIHVEMLPHEERVWSLTRFFKGLLRLDPGAAWRGNYSQRDVMGEVRGKLRRFRDLRTSVSNYPSFNIGGGRFEIDFTIRGPELTRLAEYTEALRQRSEELGITDADTTLKLQEPELRVRIDRARAADLGIDAQDIGAALRLMVGGEEEVSRYRDPVAGEDYDVQLRLTEADRDNPRLIDQLYLPRRGGSGAGGASASAGGASQDGAVAVPSGPGASRLVQLGNIASLESARTAGRIDRVDRQRMAALRASVAPGYALADRLEALRQATSEMNLPAAYSTKVSGRGRELERTFTEFLWAFLMSVVLMYIILAMNYESLVHPFTILLSLPLTVPFALLSLWATGGTLNLYSALGILVLFGVVKKNSILQIDHMNHLRAQGMPRFQAIIQANRDRLRPILMTTLALVAGMLPLAVGTGPGAEERQAVAVVVIGGQSLSLLLTLLVTPVVYSLLDDVAARFRRRRPADDADVDAQRPEGELEPRDAVPTSPALVSPRPQATPVA